MKMAHPPTLRCNREVTVCGKPAVQADIAKKSLRIQKDCINALVLVKTLLLFHH